MRTTKALTLTTAALAGLLMSATVANAAEIYSDNFNRTDSNTIGSQSGSAWTEIGQSANAVRIESNRAVLSGENGDSVDAAIYRTISTLGYNNISLSFQWDRQNSNSEDDDFLYAEWRVGSTAWTNVSGTILATYDLEDNSGFLNSGTLLLGAGAANQANIQIRFRTNVSQSNEGALIDNVLLSGDLIQTGPTPVPEPLTLSLFGVGLAGAALIRRRRKA